MPIRYQINTRRHPSVAGQVTTTIVTGRQWSLTYQGRTWRPPTDVYETTDAIVVKLEVAGVFEDDFDITLAEGNLSVRGCRSDPAEKLGYRQMEIAYGEFSVEVQLAMPVQADHVTASYENGFLLINLPKDNRRV